MAATYEPIATTTLTNYASTIDFTNIPATYTDLRIVLVGQHRSTTAIVRIRVNSDTGTNYSYTSLRGTGSGGGEVSARSANISRIECGNSNFNTTDPSLITADWFSYAGSTYKTCLVTTSQDRNGSGVVYRTVGLWRSTSAITSITMALSTGDYKDGTTVTLYGILKA